MPIYSLYILHISLYSEYLRRQYAVNIQKFSHHFAVFDFTPEEKKAILEFVIRFAETSFDRWGNKLFEAADEAGLDEETSWDGTFKGTQLNPGVFVYEVDVEFVKRADEAAARKKVFTGTITLVR